MTATVDKNQRFSLDSTGNACRSFLTHLWKLGIVIQKTQFLKMYKRQVNILNGMISKTCLLSNTWNMK